MARKPVGSMPWLKLWHEFLDSAKIQRVTESLRARYVNLLCVACKEDASGKLPSAGQMAFMLRLSEDEMIATLNALVDAHLLEIRAKSFWVHDWEHWQCRKSPDAIKQQRYRDKGNALRNGHGNALRNDLVTSTVTPPRASGSVSNSESQEEGTGGKPPPDAINDPAAVRGVADAAEARWPCQDAPSFTSDLCRTFDWRLVGYVLDRAYDKDPRKLPRAWVRSGCQNEFNRGWTPPEPGANGTHAPTAKEVEDEVEKWVRIAKEKGWRE